MSETNTKASRVVSGRWRLEGLLGQGGMSDVYRAVDETGGGAVAVKIVRSSDPTIARRLAQEAKALEGFQHPGLVRLLDAGVHEQQAYMVMELVEGPTLASRLRRGPLGTTRSAALGSGLADALAYVHERGIVHRDLKPANVLLGPGPRVRIADFGIAKLLDASSMTLTGSTLGTAAYMAPEQIHNTKVGTAADIWSLGVILLESLTGRKVFEGSPQEVVARRLVGPLRLPPDLPTSWRLLLGAMLDESPTSRPTAPDVAGMIAARAFKKPWHPLADGADLTETAARGPEEQAGQARVGTAMPPDAGTPDGATIVDKPEPTLVGPPVDRNPRQRLWRYALPAAAVIVAVAVLSAWAASGKGTAHASANRARNSVARTTVPAASNAAATLLRDVESGAVAGTVSPEVAQAIRGELDQALTASGNHNTNEVSSALGTIDSTVAYGATSGQVTPKEDSRLTSDVAVLAEALGASTTTTTTTTAPPPTTPAPRTGGGAGSQGTGPAANSGPGSKHGGDH
jgi:eukaryotic-like serine/threonine-protein kinase